MHGAWIANSGLQGQDLRPGPFACCRDQIEVACLPVVQLDLRRDLENQGFTARHRIGNADPGGRPGLIDQHRGQAMDVDA